jgi:hypothetical protein
MRFPDRRTGLGCVLQDSGKIAEGRKEVMAAEKLRQDILGKEWTPAQSEEDFKGPRLLLVAMIPPPRGLRI